MLSLNCNFTYQLAAYGGQIPDSLEQFWTISVCNKHWFSNQFFYINSSKYPLTLELSTELLCSHPKIVIFRKYTK